MPCYICQVPGAAVNATASDVTTTSVFPHALVSSLLVTSILALLLLLVCLLKRRTLQRLVNKGSKNKVRWTNYLLNLLGSPLNTCVLFVCIFHVWWGYVVRTYVLCLIWTDPKTLLFIIARERILGKIYKIVKIALKVTWVLFPQYAAHI